METGEYIQIQLVTVQVLLVQSFRFMPSARYELPFISLFEVIISNLV